MNINPNSDEWMTEILEFYFKGKITSRKEGNSGQIFIVDHGENVYPRFVAYKSLKNFNPEKLVAFENEIKNWFKSQNPYLVRPFYVQTIIDNKYVCMPAFEGSLEELLKCDFDLDSAYIYSLQIIKGIMNLNNFGVKHHQDLNPPNILFRDLSKYFQGFPPDSMHPSFKYKLYISDLGIADLYDPETSTNKFGGKWAFRSPEQYPEGQNIKGFAPDIFALGVILTLLFTRTHPSGLLLHQVNKRNPKNPKGGWLNWAINGERIIKSKDNSINEAILKMLSPLPSERPKIEDIFSVINESLLTHNANIYSHMNFYFGYFDIQDVNIDGKQRDPTYWKNIK